MVCVIVVPAEDLCELRVCWFHHEQACVHPDVGSSGRVAAAGGGANRRVNRGAGGGIGEGGDGGARRLRSSKLFELVPS